MRSHGDLRPGAYGTIQRLAQRKGFGFRFAVQYLRTLRASSWSHRKPGRSVAACGPASGRNEFLVFCGEYAKGAFFQLHAGGAQQKCVEVPAAAGRASGGPTATTSEAAKSEQETIETSANQGQTAKRQSSMNQALKNKKELILETA